MEKNIISNVSFIIKSTLTFTLRRKVTQNKSKILNLIFVSNKIFLQFYFYYNLLQLLFYHHKIIHSVNNYINIHSSYYKMLL